MCSVCYRVYACSSCFCIDGLDGVRCLVEGREICFVTIFRRSLGTTCPYTITPNVNNYIVVRVVVLLLYNSSRGPTVCVRGRRLLKASDCDC